MALCPACKNILDDAARFCTQCGSPQPAREAERRFGDGSELDLEWGRVVVGPRIGEGGMGVVHRGWLYYNPAGSSAGTPAHPVAVKVLHPMLKSRERARRLFKGEASALGRLSHPNIVHFFAMAELAGQLAIVLELVEGEPLSELIARQAKSSTPGGLPCMAFMRAWHFFSQLLGALAAIHALGIIHRDVKPSNVLVRVDGVVKLTDFGIARLPADEAKNTGGMAPGTGAYMSPEQVLGKDIDARGDLYSAAIVLYEMLTGVTPFDSPLRNEIMVRTAQIEESPPPFTSFVPQAPPVLDLLFSRALAKDPMHRFNSAIELGEAFREALSLPESAGWAAQQRLADHAQAISQLGLRQSSPSSVPKTQADQMRTDVMAAYEDSSGARA
ncbi:MAG: protein kinase [Myxococcales bacterium]|nr:protein kinase [Myxococcales bacterium]